MAPRHVIFMRCYYLALHAFNPTTNIIQQKCHLWSQYYHRTALHVRIHDESQLIVITPHLTHEAHNHVILSGG